MCTNMRDFMNYLLKKSKKNYKLVRSHILYVYGISSLSSFFIIFQQIPPCGIYTSSFFSLRPGSSSKFHLVEYIHLLSSAFVQDLSEKNSSLSLNIQNASYILINYSDLFLLHASSL